MPPPGLEGEAESGPSCSLVANRCEIGDVSSQPTLSERAPVTTVRPVVRGILEELDAASGAWSSSHDAADLRRRLLAILLLLEQR